MKKLLFAAIAAAFLAGSGVVTAAMMSDHNSTRSNRTGASFMDHCQEKGHTVEQCQNAKKRAGNAAKRSFMNACEDRGKTAEECKVIGKRVHKQIKTLKRNKLLKFVKMITTAKADCRAELGDDATKRELRQCMKKAIKASIKARVLAFRAYREACLAELGDDASREDLKACTLEKHDAESDEKEEMMSETSGSSDEPAEDTGVTDADAPTDTSSDAYSNYGEI